MANEFRMIQSKDDPEIILLGYGEKVVALSLRGVPDCAKEGEGALLLDLVLSRIREAFNRLTDHG